MNLVEKWTGLYDVEVDGKKVGSVWQKSHDFSWHGKTLDNRPVGTKAGFLSKEWAAEAVVDAS